MLPSLNTAVSGLQQFEQEISVIGNNIANVDTTGFKGSRALFQDTFSQALNSPTMQVGSGVSTAAIQNNFTQGTYQSTGIDTDLFINGPGFFSVRNAVDNTQYVTRAGDFNVDSSGYLVNSSGMRVQGYTDTGLSTVGDVMIDATGAPGTGASYKSCSIDNSGVITVALSDGTSFVRGQVLLENFQDTDYLSKAGGNLYTASAAAGSTGLVAPQSNGTGALQSGALEMSNVDLTDQMAGLIAAQRAFEANARMITTSDELLQDVVNLKR
jgi:flagellar hook protein FlgE